MQEISITDISGVRIGQAQNEAAGTGCTVLLCGEAGAPAGLDVRGGGPASRDSEVLKPLANADRIHAVLLGGGSAFGLDAAGGVMQYLEQRGIGFDVGVTRVPLVCQANLFDLSVGDGTVRPDKQMGYDACVAADTGNGNYRDGNYRDGNYGAGTGATVGKLYGVATCMKSGIGSYAVQIGELQVGALVAVNSFGDVFDWKTGEQVAGLLNDENTALRCTCDEMYRKNEIIQNKFTGNTTLGVVLTNAKFDKRALCKIAGVAHNGYARAIRPVHTTADGDSIFALSLGEVAADLDMVSTLASDVMAQAIVNAVRAARTAYGRPACCDLGAAR
jgi:L-aminopeptidase/D-esterase-like protein